jgi:hypothetical protein
MLENGNRREEAEKSGSSFSVTGNKISGAVKTDSKQNQPVPDAAPVPDPAPHATEKQAKQTKSAKSAQSAKSAKTANPMHRPVQGETKGHGPGQHDPKAHGPEACSEGVRIRLKKDGEKEAEERKRPGTGGGKRVREWKNQMTREIFYADVKIGKKIFLNDWNKHIYLRLLQYNLKPFRTELYGFCVLDDRVRLLAGGQDVHPSTIRRLLEGSFEAYEDHMITKGEHELSADGIIAWLHIVRIADERDALGVLRYIHLTSSSEGYTRLAQDYWWSSYSSYRKQGSMTGCGSYQKHDSWPMLDTGFLVRYMESIQPGPKNNLTEYHRRGEALANPIPDCIRKGEFERMFLNSRDMLLQGHATG